MPPKKSAEKRREMKDTPVQASWKRLLRLRKLAREATDKALESAAVAAFDREESKKAQAVHLKAEFDFHKLFDAARKKRMMNRDW
jgi:hypothetical protein